MKIATALPKHAHRGTTVAVYRRAVSQVIDHLRANLEEDITLEDMADVAMLSPFHFNRIFREITGVSPVRYLYALRIAEAKRLILTTPFKIIDICYAVGYNSLGSFNNRFVSLVGCSPRRIRSLAARVDPAELRRLIDGRAAIASPDAPDACSIWGTTSVTSGFSGVAVVALFLGPPSNAYPVASALCEGGAYLLPPVPEDSDYFVMAVGLSWHEQMVDFLLQPNPLQAAALPPIHLSASGMASPIHFHLAPRQPIDAPIPPSLALRLVEQFMRLPEELPKHRVRPSQRVLGLAAAPPRPSHRPAPYDSRVAGPISLTPAE